jgi:benzylsuccinate CoA-transferase BbsF subunit
MHPLTGIRVIECGVAIAGPLAASWLARMGAEVIKIESRGTGMAAYSRPPAWAPADIGAAGGDLLAANNTFNSDKLSLALELKSAEGRTLLDQLIAKSDVFLTNLSVPAIDSLRIDAASVRAANPDIIHISMAGYGAAPGPYRRYRSWGPNLAAFSGLDDLTGDPDRQPVMTPVPLPDYGGGYHALVAVISALLYRRATGRGQDIDLSQFAATTACLGPMIGQVSLDAGSTRRDGNRDGTAAPRGVFPCRGDDRWVAITVTTDEQWLALCRVAQRPDWVHDARFTTREARLAHQDELEAAIGGWTATRTPHEVAMRLQQASVPAAPVQDPWDLLADPQLEARRHWRLVSHDRLGVDLVAGLPLQFSDTPTRMERAAPSFGSGNQEVVTRVLGLPAPEVERLTQASALAPMAPMPESVAHPLERPYFSWLLPKLRLPREETVPSIADEPPSASAQTRREVVPGKALGQHRVLDLSGALGAYGGKLLADLGADVIRVEPPGVNDLAGMLPVTGGHSLARLYLEMGKRSVTLDLDTADGQAMLRRLVQDADVLFEGLPPGYLAERGLDWEALHALNPRLVQVSVTPFGQSGPYREWQAEDLTLWALSGMLQVSGYPDRPPRIPGAHLSHYFIGAVGAVGTVAALHARELTGRGQQVDVSAHEVLVTAASGLPAGLEALGAVRKRAGSRALGAAPWGYYQCRDRLICLLALFPDHWDTLAAWIHEETGIAEVLDSRFKGSAATRYAFVDEITGHINALTGQYGADEFCVLAQARGVPAAPVNSATDTLKDPHLAAQDYWVDIDQPGVGRIRWPGAPYKLSETPWAVTRPAPAPGQHNAEVFERELAPR